MRSIISRASRGDQLEARGAQLAGLAPVEEMPAVNRALVQVVDDLLASSEQHLRADNTPITQVLRTALRTMRHVMPAVRESIAKLPPEEVAEIVRNVLENFRPLLDVGVLQLPGMDPTAAALAAAETDPEAIEEFKRRFPTAETIEVPDHGEPAAEVPAGSDAGSDQPASA